ncbi:tRNA pseudouridine(38-40) synthase TruA [Natrarchaeobius halalkaliphilus]|uniref:tRNA pseudouridine synthase A n=1 Tax=Natrarchaeobius halalkaliphilus TaxID=1679091 RepID=A0A3N6LSJ6_9EURY|nr:tRNA pseudouridine(38-40) synthase TruA [Natrarchaeobius halalkaliphilus]RQG92923.1 tRNA pseudouridine(38-40) synthase TruA [Natrarchaeobius halalkaliphilus]
MSMRAFRIAYDGTEYAGYQRQPDVPTVENAIFDALRSLGVLGSDARKPDGYAAAGRTDAGVSALAQTIGLESPEWLTPRALNGELPGSIRSWASACAPDDFHATHHASRREYTYHLHAPAVDDDRFAAACEALSGPHDVHNLTPDDRNTERSPTLESRRDGDFLVVTVTASGFARELVRRLVSLASAVGSGESPPEKIDRVFAPESLPGHEGIQPAPPEPLVLTDVEYPRLSFEVDPAAAETAREVFDARSVERRARARVARMVADGVQDRGGDSSPRDHH